MRMIHGRPVALQAHRGVSTEYPENTMAAFRAAVSQKYDIIELDPKFTKDGQCVVLHDRSICRTGRTSQGQPAPDCLIADLTLAEARAYEYGSWKAPQFAGEQIPLLEEVLRFAHAHHMPLKLDNVIERFSDEQTEILFDLVEQTAMQALAGFTCTRMDYLQKVTKRFPNATIHYDGATDEQVLRELTTYLEDNPLVIWLPYPTRLNSWCKTPPVTEERMALVRAYGAKAGLWILEDEADLEDACLRFQPDYIETTGSLKP